MSNTQKSQILNKLKTVAKGAWNRARKVDAKPRGGGGFPPNLKNIVAACQSYKMATTNTASKDPYFMLTAIVKDPEELVGRRASFMWFINDSEWATVEENLNQMSSDLQMLGEEMPEDIGNVVDVLASLCERGVHLMFNTGGPKKSGKSPSLFIQGLAEEWPDEPQEGAGEAEAKPAGGKGGKPANKNQKPAEADAGDDTQTDDAGDGGDAGTDEDPPADKAPWEPAKGEQYKYTPPKSKNAIFVTVTAVDKKKKTFDLKGGKPPKVFKAVKWWTDKEETNASVE